MLGLLAQSVTWIKVDRPTFDLVGVVLSSLSLAGICAAIALALGGLVGLTFILRGRRLSPLADRLSLHLVEAPPQ